MTLYAVLILIRRNKKKRGAVDEKNFFLNFKNSFTQLIGQGQYKNDTEMATHFRKIGDGVVENSVSEKVPEKGGIKCLANL
jgi:hypothetical protein